MVRQSTRLRALLRNKTFLHMPSVYDAIGGRLVQSLGYQAAYIGGYVTGGSTARSSSRRSSIRSSSATRATRTSS
jgi:methylisocitrate lyase